MGGKTSDSVWTDITTAVAVASILGFSGFIYSSVDSIRKDRLEDAKGQIGDLYGPLCALISVHTSIWNQLSRKTGESRRTFDIEALLEPLDHTMRDKILGSGVSIVLTTSRSDANLANEIGQDTWRVGRDDDHRMRQQDIDILGPLGRWRLAPCREGLLGGGHRLVDLLPS